MVAKGEVNEGTGEIDKNPNKDEKYSIRNRVSNTTIMLYDDLIVVSNE